MSSQSWYLIIKNLPPEISEESLKELLEFYGGSIKELKMLSSVIFFYKKKDYLYFF